MFETHRQHAAESRPFDMNALSGMCATLQNMTLHHLSPEERTRVKLFIDEPKDKALPSLQFITTDNLANVRSGVTTLKDRLHRRGIYVYLIQAGKVNKLKLQE